MESILTSYTVDISSHAASPGDANPSSSSGVRVRCG